MNGNRFPWQALLVILALLLAACGSEETPQPPRAVETTAIQPTVAAQAQPAMARARPTEEPTQAPTATPTAVPPTATPTAIPPTATPVPTQPAMAGEIALPDETLDSYRSRATSKVLKTEGDAEFPMAALLFGDRVIETEYVRDPKSTHLTMTMAEVGGVLETITIGDQTWLNMGSGWMSIPATAESSAAAGQQPSQIDLNQMLKDMQRDMRRLGKDTVNGKSCQRYAIDSEFTLPIPAVEAAAQAMLPTAMTGKIQGEICVADERDLPPVVVQEQSIYDVTLEYASGAQETVKFEQVSELFDLNEPFAIEPPEGATMMPGLP